MIGITQIRLTKNETSELLLSNVEIIVTKELKSIASAIKFKILAHDEKLSIGLSRPISLQTVNKLINNLQENKITIKSFSWEEIEEGAVRRGRMNIIIQ